VITYVFLCQQSHTITLITRSSIVIDHLQQYFNDEDVGISFIYCDYKDRKHQTRSNLISSLVKQLASQRNAIPDEVKALFSEHKEGKTSPSLYDYSKTLSQLSNCFRRSFIIVDALDEHVDKEEDSAVQMEFLARLRQIQLQSNPKNLCRLFFTSRENQSIQTQHFGCGRINIRAVDSDITLFVRSRIFDSSKFRFAAQVQRDADLARTITETLIKSAQGMSVSSSGTIYVILTHPLLGSYCHVCIWIVLGIKQAFGIYETLWINSRAS